MLIAAPWLFVLLAGALAASVTLLFVQRRRAQVRGERLRGCLQAARADCDLMRKVLAAQQDTAAVGSLAAHFAHDANNHLTVILSCLDVVGAAGQPDPDARQAVELANGAARRLADDTHALLARARGQVLQVEPVALADAMHNARDVFRQLPGPGLDVLVHLPADLAIPADPDRVVAAFLHLLSFGQRRGAAAIVVTGSITDVASRSADRPMLRKGRYCCVELELVGGTLHESRLRADLDPGHVLARLHDVAGLELAAVETFAIALRGRLVVSDEPGINPRVQLLLPAVA